MHRSRSIPAELGLRADPVREGRPARDDHAQPAGGAERVRLQDAARARAGLRGRELGRRHPRRRDHGRGTRVLCRRRPEELGRRAPRQPAPVLEVVRRVQGHARPAARDRQADGRAHSGHRGRRRQRAADGLRSRRHGRRRVHPPRRAGARLRSGGRRDAVAADHGRRPPRARDPHAVRGDPGGARGGVGARQLRRSRAPSSTRRSTRSSRSSRRSCRRRCATRSSS